MALTGFYTVGSKSDFFIVHQMDKLDMIEWMDVWNHQSKDEIEHLIKSINNLFQNP